MAVESPVFDELDHRLLHALQLDGRAPFSRIAAVLGVSDQTVARRYRRLYAHGGMRVLGVADPDRLGQTRWMLRLRCAPDAAESIAKALARRPDTAWIGLNSGGTEVVCVTRARSRDERDALLLGKLPRTPSIVEIGAHCLLHTFYGGTFGWYAKSDSLTEEQVAALTPARGPAEAAASSGPVTLDPHDDRLLDALARDGRASYPELRDASGLSESAVKRRVDQLRESGVLYIDVQFDSARLGYDTHTILWLTVAPSALAAVGTALARHAETAFISATTGPSNLVAVAICRDTAHLYQYMSEKVGALEGVLRVESSPTLRKVKQLSYEEPPAGAASKARRAQSS